MTLEMKQRAKPERLRIWQRVAEILILLSLVGSSLAGGLAVFPVSSAILTFALVLFALGLLSLSVFSRSVSERRKLAAESFFLIGAALIAISFLWNLAKAPFIVVAGILWGIAGVLLLLKRAGNQ